MMNRVQLTNLRLLLAILIAAVGMAGMTSDALGQVDGTPTTVATPVDNGEVPDDDPVDELPSTGQGPSASSDNELMLWAVAAAGVLAITGAVAFRARRA